MVMQQCSAEVHARVMSRAHIPPCPIPPRLACRPPTHPTPHPHPALLRQGLPESFVLEAARQAGVELEVCRCGAKGCRKFL